MPELNPPRVVLQGGTESSWPLSGLHAKDSVVVQLTRDALRLASIMLEPFSAQG